MNFTHLAGMLPAVVFPMATMVQLVRIVRRRSTAGVSLATWLLFGFANIGIYIYAERYTEWQAILGMLLTAVLDFVIVGLVLCAYRPAMVEPNIVRFERDLCPGPDVRARPRRSGARQ